MYIVPVIEEIFGGSCKTVIENSLAAVTVLVASVAVIVNVVVVSDATESKLPVIAPVELFKETLLGNAPVVTA